MMRPCTSCSSGPMSGRGLRSVVMMDAGRPMVALQAPIRLGEIRLADTLITSGAVIAALDDVNQHRRHLQADIIANQPAIQANAVGQRFFADWMDFGQRWDNFFAGAQGHFSSGLDYLSGATVNELRNYAAEYNALELRYTAVTGLNPTYNPAGPSIQTLPTEAWIGIGIGAGLIGLGLIAWGMSSYAKVAAPLRGRRR